MLWPHHDGIALIGTQSGIFDQISCGLRAVYFAADFFRLPRDLQAKNASISNEK